MDIPPEVEMKAGLPSNDRSAFACRPRDALNAYRPQPLPRGPAPPEAGIRDGAGADTRLPVSNPTASHRLTCACSRRSRAIVGRYLREKVYACRVGARRRCVPLALVRLARGTDYLPPYDPADESGEAGEAPCYETGRGPGSTSRGGLRDATGALPRHEEPPERGRTLTPPSGSNPPPTRLDTHDQCAFVGKERRPRIRDSRTSTTASRTNTSPTSSSA